MYRFDEKSVSSAEKRIKALPVGMAKPEAYVFRRIDDSSIHIPNRSIAWEISVTPDGSDAKRKLSDGVREYNAYLDMLDGIEGFKEFFVDHGFAVTLDDVKTNWSDDVAKKVFSKKQYVFTTDLRIIENTLIDSTVSVCYNATIEGETVKLPVGRSSEAYPDQLGNKHLLWNWVGNGHDFCLFLWELLGEPSNPEDEDEDNAVVYAFDAYDQIRFEPVEPQLVRIFNKLENLGYIKTYTINSIDDNVRWRFFGKPDGSIDCAVVDTSFLKNKLTMEQISLMLWTPSEVLNDNPYFLTDKDNHQHLSSAPGMLGGHRKLKIYGRLDCPSARKHLEKGQYAKNRVFFLTEEIAADAGYRPCAKCMPKEYRKWKAEREEAKFQQDYWEGYEQGFYQ